MIRVEGKLSDLFDKSKEIYLKISKEKQRRLAQTMINRPITHDGKPIGFIKAVRVDEDKWIGFILESGFLELDTELNHCCSVELVRNKRGECDC